jgi:hypothetical protein
MPLADYRCDRCGLVVEDDVALGEAFEDAHDDDRHELRPGCGGTFRRIWSAPHTGRGSAGEPPR